MVVFDRYSAVQSLKLGGLTNQEVGKLLKISPRTVSRDLNQHFIRTPSIKPRLRAFLKHLPKGTQRINYGGKTYFLNKGDKYQFFETGKSDEGASKFSSRLKTLTKKTNLKKEAETAGKEAEGSGGGAGNALNYRTLNRYLRVIKNV